MSIETIGCKLRIKYPEAAKMAEARALQWTQEELEFAGLAGPPLITLADITRAHLKFTVDRQVAEILNGNPLVDLFSQGYVAPKLTYRSRLRYFANETKRRARNTWLALCGHNLEAEWD